MISFRTIIRLVIYLVLILSNIYSTSLLICGVLVFSERNTGPDLTIVTGSSYLKYKCKNTNINSFRSAYTTYKLESNIGPKDIGLSYAFYEVVGSKKSHSRGKIVPILKIDRFHSFFVIIFFFILSSSILLSRIKEMALTKRIKT